MNKFLVSTISLFLLTGFSAQAKNVDSVWRALVKSKGTTASYPRVIKTLIDNDLYFTSIPYLKEYIFTQKGKRVRKIDLMIDEVISQVGVKQFEVLPTRALSRSHAPIVKYILAKKHFRFKRYKKALASLNGTIPTNHPTKPFALFLEGSIHSIRGKNSSAVEAFKECVDISNKGLSRAKSPNRKRQLAINRDYCTVGIARSQFASKKHEDAYSSYLDLPKESYVWPEILFEEAWNSFYLKDYNRTLGKLVTYKAPLLSFVFNPEVEVLQALTYLELCLWGDAKAAVNDFYDKYEKLDEGLLKLLEKHGKDYKYYYLLAKSWSQGRVRGNKLVNKLLHYITRDASYIELFDSFQKGRNELERIKGLRNNRLKRVLMANVKESLLLQRNLIGAYVRKQLWIFKDQMTKSFEGMSYIKLEILALKKQRLYDPESNVSRNRGDIVNLKRTEKQYFWSFNGEFWADELGDYVFSLKSECGRNESF
jgi:hypothetical protein